MVAHALGVFVILVPMNAPILLKTGAVGRKKIGNVSAVSGIEPTTRQDGKTLDVNVTCCRTVRYHRLIPRNVFRLIVDTHQRMNWWERGFLLQEWVWWTDCNSIGFLGAWGWIVC